MGSFLGKPGLTRSPNHAMNFLTPNMIETKGSVKIEIMGYSNYQIISQLDLFNDKIGDHKLTIVYVLKHDDFMKNLPEKQQMIHFINSRCESILQIVNSVNKPMDRVMAINVDVLEKQ